MSDIDLRLHIRIENPSAALETALLQFLEVMKAQGTVVMDDAVDAETAALWKVFDEEIDYRMLFSKRAVDFLKYNNVVLVGALVGFDEGEILRHVNTGRQTLNQLKKYLAERKVYLGMDRRGWKPKLLRDRG